MPQFWIYHTRSQRKLPGTFRVTHKRRNMAEVTFSKFLDLPVEVLRIVPQYLPYQTTLRLLSTCRYLSTLLKQDELTALRLKDASEVLVIEEALWKKAYRCRSQGEQFSVTKIPCYTCLRWLVRLLQSWNSLIATTELLLQDPSIWFFGRWWNGYADLRRICVPCRSLCGEWQKGYAWSGRWKICLQCGQPGYRTGTGSPQYLTAKSRSEGALLLHKGDRYCESCAGADGECIAELDARRDPIFRRQEQRVAAMRRKDEVRETRRATRALQDSRGPDLLAASLTELNMSELFTVEQ